MNHPCEVQAVAKSWRRRLADRLRRGHARHVCARYRPFMQEHEDDHQCRCGQVYAKQATDNGPVPRVRLFGHAG